MRMLFADYRVSSCWDLHELELNLNQVFDWYIKYDCLFVQSEMGGEWKEFPGSASENISENVCEYLKRPTAIECIEHDDTEVKDSQNIWEEA
jgi:hypothetical protein